MLLALEESELGELGIPSWSGDRRRLMEAIARLREQAGREDTDPPHAANDAGESEVGQWLMSAGFGRFRQLFAQFRVESLAEVSQMERDDLAEMGVPDGGGQLGRLMAAIGGLRYTFQTGSISVRGSPPNVDGSARARSVFGDVSYRSGRSRRMKEDDAGASWCAARLSVASRARAPFGFPQLQSLAFPSSVLILQSHQCQHLQQHQAY